MSKQAREVASFLTKVANGIGAEEALAQIKWERLTKADREAHVRLFPSGVQGVKDDREMVFKLFSGAQSARLGRRLQVMPEDEGGKEKTSAVADFVARFPDHPALRRFPELRKAGAMIGSGGIPSVPGQASPILKKPASPKSPTGATPVQPMMSGGSAG